MSGLPIIFLDIDGVLNSHQWHVLNPEVSRGGDMLDDAAIRVLNHLIIQTDAEVVISSVWRGLYERKELLDLLRKHGFTGTIIGDTPHLARPAQRGDEIGQWLAGHAFDARRFVILDDDHDMGELLPHLILIDNREGLSPWHIPMARYHLLGEGWG